jgi:hypothetical protein
MRLSFVTASEADIRTGIAALAMVLRTALRSQPERTAA